MNTREFKGLELAARAKIEQRKMYWYVPSAKHNGGYHVDHDATNCSCEDFELHGQPCKHVYAVRFVKERNRGKPLPETEANGQPEQKPPTKKQTYRQNWKNYNAA